MSETGGGGIEAGHSLVGPTAANGGHPLPGGGNSMATYMRLARTVLVIALLTAIALASEAGKRWLDY